VGIHPLLRDIQSASESFSSFPPRRRTKVTGALAVEVIRHHLELEGIPVSRRDVFLAGMPFEIDLLVPGHNARPMFELVYAPEQVAAVLEIKYSGIYSRDEVQKLKGQFDAITRHHSHIRCHFVTVFENKDFKYQATQLSLGYPVHTLHWTNRRRDSFERTDGWGTLVTELRILSKVEKGPSDNRSESDSAMGAAVQLDRPPG